jgi:hypothetical protein
MSMTPESVSGLFAVPMLDQMPRLLSQVDRNPHSPTYGCCCRNHWHYRIEDIANSQMQEMVLTFALVWKLDRDDNYFYQSPLLLDWIEAILAYTRDIQRNSGCFDEVYRGQDSYAATAFVTFYVSETILQLGKHLDSGLRRELDTMLYRAASWLGRTREALAGNQVSGAAAAFMNLIALDPGRGYEDGFTELIENLTEMQTNEGWFPEYGGADIGYASLTHSYLTLIANRTDNRPAKKMAAKSAEFLQHMLHRDGTVGGEYGSRNTAYFIPVGAVLSAGDTEASARLFHGVARGLESGEHALMTDCLDDRYLAYLSPYYLLAAHDALALSNPLPAVPDPLQGAILFEEAGLWCVEKGALKLVANLRKGGVFHLDLGETSHVDSGYFGGIPDGQIVCTQRLDTAGSISVKDSTARLTAALAVVRPVGVSPWKNIAVRAFNLVAPAFCRRLFLDFLRNRAVSSGESVGKVHREIVVEEETVHVTDFIEVFEPVLDLELQMDSERAFSFASTGFFQPQEMFREDGALPVQLAEGKVVVKRRYTAEGMAVID